MLHPLKLCAVQTYPNSEAFPEKPNRALHWPAFPKKFFQSLDFAFLCGKFQNLFGAKGKGIPAKMYRFF
jgi:hypothetical protein